MRIIENESQHVKKVTEKMRQRLNNESDHPTMIPKV